MEEQLSAVNKLKVKGMTVVTLHHLLGSLGPEKEQAVKQSLSDKALTALEEAMPVSWIDAELYSEMLDKSVGFLYPDSSQPLIELGRIGILNNFSSIYKFMFKFTTVSFLNILGPNVWSTYFSHGKAFVENFDRHKQGDYIVRGAADIPLNLLDVITGGILRFFEIAKAKQIRIDLNRNNPEAWQWHITWTLK